MSARRKRVISTEEIQFNHKPAKMLLTEKKKGISQNGQTPSIIGICSYCVLDRPVFERCQTLFHPELTPWWSFLLADGAHHKKPHSPTHPQQEQRLSRWADFTKNCLPRIECKEFAKNITLLGATSAKFAKSVGKKMGSNMRPRYIQFRDIHDCDISGLHCIGKW